MLYLGDDDVQPVAGATTGPDKPVGKFPDEVASLVGGAIGNISTRMMGTGFLPGGTNGIGGRVPASGSERHLLQVWEHFDGEAFHSFEVLALGLAQVGAQDDLVEAGLRVFG